MKRRTVVAVAAFGTCALVAAWAHAVGAPPDQYLIFDKSDQTISDQQTKLTWERYPSGPTTYALHSCTGGYRLPTYKELLTLVDEDPHYEYDADSGQSTLRYIDPNAFPGTPPDNFWTLSADNASGAGYVKVVDFGSGRSQSLKATGSAVAYTRCVK